MNKKGPIIIIEDDLDDQELLKDAFVGLKISNEIICFTDGASAFDFLTKTDKRPFLIFSDLNMPGISGFQLRDMLHKNRELRLKCIPYLFFTTSSNPQNIIDAYSKSIQGFFTKPDSYPELIRVISNIVEYWKDCHSPPFK